MSRSTPPSPSQREAPADPFAGSRYRGLSKLASGSLGDLYVVEHRELGKRFAARLLRPDLRQDPRIVDRLRLEAQSLGRLRHPNIVGITGFERTAQGAPFIVMELLKGRNLEDALAVRGALPVLEAFDLTKQLLSALEAAHEFGIVHRDIKPKNLFVHQPPTGPCVLKLLDFGKARVLRGASERAPRPLSVPTQTGAIVGTPLFASPEAARGQAIDARTDIYQVGLMLYLMLTGRGPFDHLKKDTIEGDASAVLHAHATVVPNPPSQQRSGGLPIEVDRIVLQALAKNPVDRFQSATEFRRKLSELRMSQSNSTIPPPNAGFGALTRFLLFLALAAMAAIFVVGVGCALGRLP